VGSWDGTKEIFVCVLCHDYLYLCRLPPVNSIYGVDQHNPAYTNITINSFAFPAFFIRIEFSALTIIRVESLIELDCD
jgi:hypothetical protein